MKTDSVIINGGHPLIGRVSIQGAKNEALPVLAASLLFKNRVILRNVPNLVDIHAMLEILEYLGASYTFESGVVTLDCQKIENKKIPDELSNKLRASSLLLGPMLARFKHCEVGMPGGCKIGVRPIDIHLNGFERLGATSYVENGLIRLTSESINGVFTLPFPSVGATENLLVSSVFNDSEVTLRNIAREPEVTGLIDFLKEGGAKISLGEDQTSYVIEGVEELHSVDYTIQPDRIETGTFMAATLATKGKVQLVGVKPEHLMFPIETFKDMGANIKVDDDSITIAYDKKLVGTDIKTAVYPGFPTDLQSQMGVLLTQSSGTSTLTETVFEHRFNYIDELLRLNANIKVDGKLAVIHPSNLSGCRVKGFDLRGTASMVIAGMCAEGVTHVSGLKHLYRGYEAFIEKLQHLGADICYV